LRPRRATGPGRFLQPALKAILYDLARLPGALFEIVPQSRYAVFQLFEAILQHHLLSSEMLLDGLAEFFPKNGPPVTFGVAKLLDYPAHFSPGALLGALLLGHPSPSVIPP
jgi:hypothetical protein